MSNFTPISASAGGVILGIAASLLFVGNGRVCGISGIMGGLVGPVGGDRLWRLVFFAGLLTGGIAVLLVDRSALAWPYEQSLGLAIVAGVLVGVGTRMGNGCTSGHGLCGFALLSKRSIVATAVFMVMGAVTVAIFRHVLTAHTVGAS